MGKEQILSWQVVIPAILSLEISGITLIALPDVPNEFGWVMVIAGGAITAIAISYHVLKRREAKDGIQRNLRKLYKHGVHRWNDGMNLDTEEKVELWIKEFETWEAEVIAVIEKRSEIDAADFETLRLMPLLPFPKAINERHAHHLRVFSEKLKRLNQSMQRFK